jgi:hypothetical protein
MQISWQLIGHAAVGIIIAGTQAVALADPNAQVVTYCHVIALMAAQIGMSLGVWQVSQNLSVKRMMLQAACVHCGKPALAPEPPKPAVAEMEAPKAAA